MSNYRDLPRTTKSVDNVPKSCHSQVNPPLTEKEPCPICADGLVCEYCTDVEQGYQKGWLDARRGYLKEFEKVVNNFNEFGNIILYKDLINWIKEQKKELRGKGK